MTDHRVETTNDRIIGCHDFGPEEGTPVLWCHGGPGSRMQAAPQIEAATAAGFRIIGIDRPGYGESTAQPGRKIGDWPADALAVANHLGINQFYIVGVSTGGCYALATAAYAPIRVQSVLTCCAMTDMRWAVDHAMMPLNAAIWNSEDRDEAIAIATTDFGEDGSVMLQGADQQSVLAPADQERLADTERMAQFAHPAPFAQGLIGYADDRIADAPIEGWASFDVSKVSCPVIVLHGQEDLIVPVAHSYHTAEIVRQAELRILPTHGHLTISDEIVPILTELRQRT